MTGGSENQRDYQKHPKSKHLPINMIAINAGNETTSLFINVLIGRPRPNQIIAHGHWNSTNALGGLNLVV